MNPEIKKILEANQRFVTGSAFLPYQTDKYPQRKIAFLTCMDTRLSELLPAALGIQNGEIKLIRNAGGMISHPYGSAIRSLLIAVYELGVTDILVIAHTDCGVQHLQEHSVLEKMKIRGISDDAICEANQHVILSKWLHGFEKTEDAVLKSMEIIKTHPLFPLDVCLYGFIMDTNTGELQKVSPL